MSPDEKRRRWRKYVDECERVYQVWAAGGFSYPAPERPVLPSELIGLCCGAKTRAGTPCRLSSIYRNGRCKFHGGLSTGPVTVEGRAKSALNGRAVKCKPHEALIKP